MFRSRRLVFQTLADHAFFAEHPEESLWGSVTDREEEALRELVREAEAYPGPILEIGTLFGLTTQLLAACKSPERKLITVDNYSWNPFSMPASQHVTFTRRALRTCRAQANVEVYEGENTAFYRDYRGERPAMVFIDALHTYEGVRADLTWAVANGIPVISGHDYSPRWPGVQRAVDEFFGPQKQIRGSVWSHLAAGNRVGGEDGGGLARGMGRGPGGGQDGPGPGGSGHRPGEGLDLEGSVGSVGSVGRSTLASAAKVGVWV